MQPSEMDRLIARHLEAEAAGDVEGAIAVYTDDVVHDVVGWPAGPMRGRDGAATFYDQLMQAITTEEMESTRRYYGSDFAVTEHVWRGTVPGSFMGVPGNGKRIAFRMLHVWEFRDGRISLENVWLDGGAIVGQLTGS